MDFIQLEAEETLDNNESLNFSDDDEITNDEMEDFTDDRDHQVEDVNYRCRL